MHVLVPTGIGILLFILLYLWLVHPCTRRRTRCREYAAARFAHRGLYDSTVPENTMPAFLLAKAEGYGIELDVRRTKDGKLVVFHDATLERSSGNPAKVADLTYDELKEIPIFNSNERIPLFADVLAVLKDTPLLVEIKVDIGETVFSEQVAELLDTYGGPYAVESFHPFAVSWFAGHRPEVLRGQLTKTHYGRDELSGFYRFILVNMLANGIAKPDFIAYSLEDTRQFSFSLVRHLFHPVLFAWTVRSEEERKMAEREFDTMIFETIRP